MDKKPISRADFFKEGFRLLTGHFGQAVDRNARDKATKFITPLLRPPGAVAEVTFLLKCTRCDSCAAVCPHRAIEKAGAELGSAMGTPVIDPEHQPCRMCEDFPCIRACTEGALVPVPPYRIGTAHVIPVKCYAFNGQVCDYCFDCCPEKGKAITMENGKPLVTADKCTGCGVCEYFCPAPGKGIRILPVRKRETPNREQIREEAE
ncbi:MAG: 4Fe-4S dicluster domain-containing protein [bacterium]|nr:4Fe-4S dicluster domain-containing protein [bacterium]